MTKIITTFPRPMLGGIVLAFAISLVTHSVARASSFTTLFQFPGGSSGSGPSSGLVEDAAGLLYGNTFQAGASTCATHYGVPSFGCGTLFSFSRSAGLTTLVTFTGPNGAYGAYTPTLIGSTLYGSTIAGGTTDNGVMFSVRTDGSGFKLLHQFTGTDGSQPSAALVPGPGHVLYGVTAQGGPAYPKRTWGVLFKLAADGTYTVLHNFTNGADGGSPTAIVVEKNGVIVGSNGYGGYKGPTCGYTGCGVIYEFDPRIGKLTVLHTFQGSPRAPGGGPMLGSLGPDGTVYGNATPFFSISPKTGFTLLPATSITTDIGAGPNIGPTLGPSGSLTSTTEGTGGTAGSLYQQLGGIITVLQSFDGYDGAFPLSAPLLTPAGSFVGTTSGGGAACSCGTIYEYVP